MNILIVLIFEVYYWFVQDERPTEELEPNEYGSGFTGPDET